MFPNRDKKKRATWQNCDAAHAGEDISSAVSPAVPEREPRFDESTDAGEGFGQVPIEGNGAIAAAHLAVYSAWSAALTKSSTLVEQVSGCREWRSRSKSSPWRGRNRSRARCCGTPMTMRSQMLRAVSASVAGSTTTNSSPPYRAIKSVSRVLPRSMRAVACSIRSPAWWPKLSLMRLKLSKSAKATLKGHLCCVELSNSRARN